MHWITRYPFILTINVSAEVNTATRSEWTNKNKKEEIKKDASKIVGM